MVHLPVSSAHLSASIMPPCGADARGSAVIYARSAPRGIVPVAGCCHAGVQSVLRQGFFLPDEKYDPVFHGDPADRIAVCCQLLFAAQKGVVERHAGKFLHRIKRQGQPRLTPFVYGFPQRVVFAHCVSSVKILPEMLRCGTGGRPA